MSIQLLRRTTHTVANRTFEKLACLLVVLRLAICSGLAQTNAGPAASQPSFAPEVAIQTEDYATARVRFRTKLLQSRPSPQKPQTVNLPQDVLEVEYPSASLRLKAWISLPATDKPGKHPAVVFLHGGFAFNNDAWKSSQPYRDAGFIVMTPMLRGENGLPGSFSLFYDEVDDVLAAAAFLRTQSTVDKERIFLAGHSAGGILTMLTVEADKGFRAAASMSGSPDQLMLKRFSPETMIPFDKSDPREFEVRSPLAYAGSFKCPVRIYYGTEEAIFDQTSRRTEEIARQHGLDVQAGQVPGNHHSSVPEAVKRSIVFFKEHL